MIGFVSEAELDESMGKLGRGFCLWKKPSPVLCKNVFLLIKEDSMFSIMAAYNAAKMFSKHRLRPLGPTPKLQVKNKQKNQHFELTLMYLLQPCFIFSFFKTFSSKIFYKVKPVKTEKLGHGRIILF